MPVSTTYAKQWFPFMPLGACVVSGRLYQKAGIGIILELWHDFQCKLS